MFTHDALIRMAKSVIVTIIAFSAPVHNALIGTVMLVFADTVTGILAAARAKKKITSFRLSRSVSKLAVYFTLIYLGHIMQALFGSKYPIAEMVAAFVSVTEALSILENLNKISKNPVIDRLIDALKRDDDDKTHK